MPAMGFEFKGLWSAQHATLGMYLPGQAVLHDGEIYLATDVAYWWQEPGSPLWSVWSVLTAGGAW